MKKRTILKNFPKNRGMSTFQIIILCVFGLCVVAGIIAFALYRGNSSKQVPRITIWGTLDQSLVDTFISRAAGAEAPITYVQKDPATFASDLVNAVATGQGPDVILGTQDQLLSNRALLTVIPYTSFPERTFLSTYATEAQLYLGPQGILGVPLAIDPLVMYWNKVLFANAGITAPPATWSQLTALVPKLTVADAAYNISQSAVGLGDYANITNAKQVLSLLLLQSGNSIVATDDTTGNLVATLASSNNAVAEAAGALSFYTQFADPTSPVYSWDSSLPDSQDLFVASQLALYFGFASEYQALAAKNPNLDFDVAIVPQPAPQPNGTQTAAGATTPSLNFGNLYGFSILRSSPNAATALADIYGLTTQSASESWGTLSGLAPVRLDSMTASPSSPTAPVFNQSALWAHGWSDPNGASTDKIFQSMVESVTSGQQSPSQAVQTAQSQLGTIL